MLLEYDKIAQVKEIAREIAKEELDAMGKALKAEITKLSTVVTDLEMDMKDLKAEIKRAKEVKPRVPDQHIEISKKHK